MDPIFQKFWFQFYETAHSSWLEANPIPMLSSSSSGLRINLAYHELCHQLDIESEPCKDLNVLPDLDFLLRLLNKPAAYLKVAGTCLSRDPRRDFAEAWLMEDRDLVFSSKTCQALSLNQRFSCQSDFPPDPYGTGVMLLHAFLVNEHISIWQRVKLAIDKSVVDELDSPDGTAELHRPVLKKLWKTVDQHLKPNLERALVAA